MGNTKKFEIVLENPYAVFSPGQCVRGSVNVDIADSITMKGIFLLCRSYSQIVWKVGNTTFRGVEDYLQLERTLIGNDSHNSDHVTLPAGNHVLPFQFFLPLDLPGSFDGDSKCYVRHWMKAIMVRPRKSNKECKMVYTVSSFLDLNTTPSAAAPVQRTASKTSSCFGCCHSGKITATFRLDKSGYVPGESFVIYGEVSDGANVGLNSTIINFFRRTIYTWEHETRRECKKRICQLRHNHISPGDTDLWNGEKLSIPLIHPSYLAGCSSIDIQYYLQIIVDIHNSCTKLRLKLPVIIGTVPLCSEVDQNPAQAQNIATNFQHHEAVTSQQQGDTAPPPTRTDHISVELHSPLYRECVFGEANTQATSEGHIAGNMNFAPS